MRKPKKEYRMICSGKDKPWHLQGQNRIHSFQISSKEKAMQSVAARNEVGAMTPIAGECAPWTIEVREVGQWEKMADE